MSGNERINEQLIAELQRQGYFEIRECLRTGKLYGLHRFIYTIGLCCDLSESGYEGRYCYAGLDECLPALRDWQCRGFEGSPAGYIKAKGFPDPAVNPTTSPGD